MQADGYPKMECAHIYGRRYKSVRWAADNALCLCSECHRTFTESPLDFERWLKGYIGEGALEILNEKRNGIFKSTKAARAEIAKHYREQIRLMEAGEHDLVSYQ